MTLNQEVKQFLKAVQDRLPRYSHWAVTSLKGPSVLTMDSWFMPLARVPCKSLNIIVWGFETDVKRNEFMIKYSAAEWAPP